MKHSRNGSGFTIVELLIVVVVIAILAAITIVSYNGITSRAKVAAIQSDLSGAYTQLSLENVNGGTYPITAAAANNGQGLKAASGTTYQYIYNASDNSYCLAATNGSLQYKVTSSLSMPSTGVCSPLTNSGTVTTLAGSGANGSANGEGAAASFLNPTGVAVDASGNMYIADANNHVIRKVTSSGTVTTYAGIAGTTGTTNGAAASATFNTPYGVTIDATGTIYVADSGNNLIRKISTSGIVSTVAGSGAVGFANGNGTAASFYLPTSLAVDTNGTIYVVDRGNNVIRKITASGTVSTFAGSTTGATGATNGTGTAALFNAPVGIAIDSSGNTYVADGGNNMIRKITSAGVVSTYAGSGTAGYTNGNGTAATFNAALGIAVDVNGVVYVADTSNNRIRKITTSQDVSLLAGSGAAGSANGAATDASFASPYALGVDSNGTVYVADTFTNKIRKIQ